MNLVKEDGHISKDEMASQLNVSLSTVKRAISKLKENRVIEHVGSTKKGHWVVK